MASFTHQGSEKKNKQIPASQPVQVVDRQKQPLAVLSLAQVRRQKLYHQLVYMISYATRQKISLEPFASKGRTCWDLSGFSLVGPGDSAFSTAEQIGTLYAGKNVALTWLTTFLDEAACQFLDVYRFSFFVEELFSRGKKQSLIVDRFEFERIFIDFPAMLGPHVSRLWQLGILFNV